jgi:signal transduction histidine kinase
MSVLKSIKWQFQFGQLFLLAAVLLTLLTLYYSLYKKERIAEVDRLLQQKLMFSMPLLISADLYGSPSGARRASGSPPEFRDGFGQPPPRPRQDFSNARSPVVEEPAKHHAAKTLEEAVELGLYAKSWKLIDGKMVAEFGDVPDSLTFNRYSLRPEVPQLESRDNYREIIFLHKNNLLVVIGKSLEDINGVLATLRTRLILIALVILLIGFVVGSVLIRRVLRPLGQISQTAERIREGNGSERVRLDDAPTELVGLADTLNQTLDHLDNMIETQKRFAADASHELRTPISVVIAQSQAALKRDRSTDEYKTVLQACLRAGDRMKVMANSLLDLTRIDSDASLLIKSSCDLNNVIKDAVATAVSLTEKHPVHFEPLNHPVMVEMDIERIHQVLMNLIGNAIRYNPTGCEINIVLVLKEKKAIVSVKDNGVGFDANAHADIFERFYRVDKSRSREQGGTGLGLSIVKSFIEAHGGEVAAAAEEGKGATFTFTIPV